MYLQYNKSRHALISINHFNTHHITYTHIPLGSASGTTLYPIHEDLSQWFYIVYKNISISFKYDCDDDVFVIVRIINMCTCMCVTRGSLYMAPYQYYN